MTIRYKTENGEKIIETDYVEVEETAEVEVHDGKWVFKDDDSKRIMG